MSLCLANGHPQARFYPLGMLYDEATLISSRENNRIVTEASLFQLAVGSILSKDSAKEFTKRLTDLSDS